MIGGSECLVSAAGPRQVSHKYHSVSFIAKSTNSLDGEAKSELDITQCPEMRPRIAQVRHERSHSHLIEYSLGTSATRMPRLLELNSPFLRYPSLPWAYLEIHL